MFTIKIENFELVYRLVYLSFLKVYCSRKFYHKKIEIIKNRAGIPDLDLKYRFNPDLILLFYEIPFFGLKLIFL